MAKKTTDKNEIDDLNFDDMGDIGSDSMNFGELEDVDSSRSPGKLGVAKELGKEAAKGASESLIKKTAAKALPAEYEASYYDVMDYADLAKSTFDENKEKVNKSVYKLGKEVKKILPFQIKALDSYLEDKESEYEQLRQESEETLRDNSIQSSIGSIFDKQLEIQKAYEARSEAKETVESKERIVSQKLNYDILASIDSAVNTQSAFTIQVSKEYYRKSLELQFKSFYIQSDMLKTIRDYYKGFSIQFENISKNTGLPDFVKLKSTERLTEIARTQVAEQSFTNFYNNNEYIKRIRENMRKKVSSKISDVTDKLDAVTGQLEMINSAGEMSGGGATIIGNTLAGLAGSTVGEKVSNVISPKIKDKIKDNKYINTGANYLGSLANSPATFFASMRDKATKGVENYSDESTPFRYLMSKLLGGTKGLLDVTDVGKAGYTVKDESILANNQPAIFDNRVHRSITEIIPMFLGKILRENTDLREMYGKVNASTLTGHQRKDEIYYNYEQRTLTSKEKIEDDLKKTVLTRTEDKSKSKAVSDRILSDRVSSLKKNPEADKKTIALLENKTTKKILTEYINSASKTPGFDGGYNELFIDYDKDVATKKLVDDNDSLKKILEHLKATESSNTTKDKERYDTYIGDINEIYPIATIVRVFKEVSILSKAKSINTIDKRQAEIFAETCMRYTSITGKAITTTSLVNGSVFRYLLIQHKDTETKGKSGKSIKTLKNTLGIFIGQMNRVLNSNDMVAISALDNILGILNNALMDGKNVKEEVFQAIRDAHPYLIDKGKISADRAMRGQLGKMDEDVFIDVEDIRSITRKKSREIREDEQSGLGNAFDNLANKITGKTAALKKEFADAKGNPFELARVSMKVFNETTSAVSSATKATYNKATESFKGIEKLANNLTDKAAKSTIVKLRNLLQQSVDELATVIASDKTALESHLERLKELDRTIKEAVNHERTELSVEKETARIKKYYEWRASIHSKLMNSIKKDISSIDKHIAANGDKPTDLVKAVRDLLNRSKERVNELIKATEDTEPTTS